MSSATLRQAEAFNRKLDANDQWVQDGYDNLDTSVAPENAFNLIVPGTQPYPNYLAPGAGPLTILSYRCPSGTRAYIQNLFIINVGGGFQDGSGDIIWSVLKNGVEAGKGFGRLFQQMGSPVIPYVLQKAISLVENDLFTITATVPATAVVQGGTAGSQIAGFTCPMTRGGYIQ